MSHQPLEFSFSREEFYERIWSTPLKQLADEFGTTGNILTSLCLQYNVPRPKSAYWTSKNQGKTPSRTPLPELPDASSAITIEVKQSAQPGVRIRWAIKQARLQNTIPEILGLSCDVTTAADGAVRNPEELSARTQYIYQIMKLTLERRGYPVSYDDRYGKTGLRALIQGEYVSYWVHEMNRAERHYYTKAEIKKSPYLANGKGWERRYVPTGCLSIGACTGYGLAGGGRSDEPEQPIEAVLGEVILAMEVIGGLAANITREREESERQWQLRRAERKRKERREYEREQRWTRLATVTNDWHQAQRVRAFLAILKEAASNDGRLAKRVAVWEAWAEEYIWHSDPLPGDPEEVLRRLARPRHEASNFNEYEDFY